MPDITKCVNEECPLSLECWRFNCPPKEYAQSYQKFEPIELKEDVRCMFYINKPE